MIVKRKFLEQQNVSDYPGVEESNLSINNENMSPCSTGELMVAIKPSAGNYNSPLNTKINMSTPNKTVFDEISMLNSRSLVSPPIKRSLTCLETMEAPLAKRSASPNSLSSICSSPNSSSKLSQSAGNNELQSVIKRVKKNLSHSCFADLRVNKSDIDSDLTCLNWLQEGNLLKGFSPGQQNKMSEEYKEKTVGCNQELHLNSSNPLNSICEVDKSLRKPAYSFSTLIFMAIENAKDKRLPVKDIYQWIQDNFPYFQKAPLGWKNSVRHNLSLNKSFKKVDKEKCIGKGSLWTIDHEARAGLVQQLRKTTTYQSYPYSRTPFPHSCSKYFVKDRTLYKRDISGRFIPNHDDAEFDVAATMCSMSTPTSSNAREQDLLRRGDNHSPSVDSETSLELLRIYRTYIEPFDYENSASREPPSIRCRPLNSKYSIESFLDEVQNKLSFNTKHNEKKKKKLLNASLDEDYEFYDSDDESSDEEMNQNMKRLVDKEKDDGLVDSGYSEEGSLRNSTLLDHSYSRSIQSLVRPHSKRESKGVAALLHLANAASKELQNINKQTSSVSNVDEVMVGNIESISNNEFKDSNSKMQQIVSVV